MTGPRAVALDDVEAPPTGTARARSASPSERWAAVAFGVVVAGAVPLVLRLNRRQWFFLDEWDFLGRRKAGSLHDLLQPHNEHWSTIPILVYRVLWRTVGLHHYWPYQVPVLAAHLGAAVLLRVVMRRAGADPWLATLGASVFALFGSGRDDIAWGFQLGFSGALALGLAHLLLADHDGPVDRRDLFGIGCGLGALLCSGVGVAMTVVVAMSVFLRRGWRPALVHAGPGLVAYVAWSAAYPPENETITAGLRPTATLFRRMLTSTMEALGGGVPGAIALVALLAVGAALVVGGARSRGRGPGPAERSFVPAVRGEAAPVAALLAGSVVFAATVARGRAALSLVPAGRYLHVLAAMVLPALVVAGTAAVRRQRLLLPLVVLVLAAGVPRNLDLLSPGREAAFTLGNRQDLLTLAEVAEEVDAPAGLDLLPGLGGYLTAGFLADGVRAGRIPVPDRVDPAVERRARLVLALEPLARHADASAGSCRPAAGAAPLRLARGQVLVARAGPVTVVERTAGGPASAAYNPIPDPRHRAAPAQVVLRVVRPMEVTLAFGGATEVSVCG